MTRTAPILREALEDILHQFNRDNIRPGQAAFNMAAIAEAALNRVDNELPESVLSSLRSHAFPNCEICGAAVDDPEAIEYCEGPFEREKRNHDVAVVNATNRNAVNR